MEETLDRHYRRLATDYKALLSYPLEADFVRTLTSRMIERLELEIAWIGTPAS
jgi:hypothetical protein